MDTPQPDTPPPNLFRPELEFLGLQEDPFRLSADPRYLYLGEEHLDVYKVIQAVILRRRGLALVTGKPGTGKSSLARYTFDSLSDRDDVDIAYIDTANFSSYSDAAKRVSRAFDSLNVPDCRSYSDQMEQLKLKIAGAYKQGHIVVLLLDDAQELRRPSLTMLLEMYNFDFGEKAITVIAFGQEETVRNFYRYPAISSRLFTVQQLKPISYSTALQMVDFRLRVAGRSTPPLFDEDAFSILYEISRGVPRELVVLGSMCIDVLVENKQYLVDPDLMRQVAGSYESVREMKYGE